MHRKIATFFNPERFQGWGKKKNYFEGWYFKVIDLSEGYAFAIIPGIAIAKSGEKHAFIQILNGKKRTSDYHRLDFSLFKPEYDKFEVRIGDNFFSEQALTINLPDLAAELSFGNNVPWPKPFYSPGIMGPYAFVPFMECYHGVVSMDHHLKGYLKMNNDHIDFTGGRGYIEKDWGQSFPSAYIWLQSNHFSAAGISIKASVAKIPWINGSFTGFIAGLYVNGQLIRFTTYNKTRLIKCKANLEVVELIFENKKYRLEILAHRNDATQLASPILGAMEGRIEESMEAEVEISLWDLDSKKQIFNDNGRNAAIEVAGKLAEIVTR